MSDDRRLVERVARAMVGAPDIPPGHTLGDINWDYFRIMAERAIAEAQRWFPIETAPTDGTTILLWWRYSRHGNVGRWVGDQDGECGWAGDEDDCIPRNQQDCLYWQSLPEPPQL